mmetsp:Transcript_1223/g.3008  ORF Transcript_1223/g.3008 Transcript_1223/m.3008 type:complete len:281 (+) Transcript_1223:2114-2956(+)
MAVLEQYPTALALGLLNKPGRLGALPLPQRYALQLARHPHVLSEHQHVRHRVTPRRQHKNKRGHLCTVLIRQGDVKGGRLHKLSAHLSCDVLNNRLGDLVQADGSQEANLVECAQGSLPVPGERNLLRFGLIEDGSEPIRIDRKIIINPPELLEQRNSLHLIPLPLLQPIHRCRLGILHIPRGSGEQKPQKLLVHLVVPCEDFDGEGERERGLVALEETPADVDIQGMGHVVDDVGQPLLGVVRGGGIADARLEQLLVPLETELVHRVDICEFHDSEEQN